MPSRKSSPEIKNDDKESEGKEKDAMETEGRATMSIQNNAALDAEVARLKAELRRKEWA